MTHRRVSVVCGVRDGGVLAEMSIRNVLAACRRQDEVVVVDDGSRDDTVPRLRAIASEDNRLVMHAIPRRGLTRALCEAIDRASGTYIARVDVGDLSAVDRIDVQATMLEAEPTVSVVGCRYRLVGPASEVLVASATPGLPEFLARGAEFAADCAPHHGSVMFRRDAYDAVGGYRDAFYFAQDLDLWSRMVEVGHIRCLDEVLYEVRYTPDSLSGRHRSAQQKLRRIIEKATAARRAGRDETPWLEKARTVRPGGSGYRSSRVGSPAQANYFIGSCLLEQDDPRAIRYLREALATSPMHLKARLKLRRAVGRWPEAA